jgi:hypothetical protein
MTAFDHLERELRVAVRRRHRRARSFWRRPLVLAAAIALVIGGGALAATGTIRIGRAYDPDPNARPVPSTGGGVLSGAVRTLGLRVADPAGGPPWTLRVFRSSRGGDCVQLGQIADGRVGVFSPPDTLEPLHAWPEGDSSICSGQSRDGFPVVRGLQSIRVIGGRGDSRRCPAGSRRECPITSVTVLRYGLLGPDARRVRLLGPGGVTLASTRTGARSGGAYLFAVARPIGPYVAADRVEQAAADRAARTLATDRARGVSAQQALVDAARSGSRIQPGEFVRPPKFSVVATFADGRVVRVAGPGRSKAALPGVAAAGRAPQPKLPSDLPVRVRIASPGRFAVVRLSFRAPVRIRRFDRHYTATLHGPIGTGCVDQRTGGGFYATTTDIAAGSTVRFVLRKPRGARENGREGWCPGRFGGAIAYSTSDGAGTSTVGTYAFTIP